MSNKLSGRELVAAVAGPRSWADTRKSWLDRAARRARVSYRTVRAVFYGEITDPNHPCVRLLQHEAERRAASRRIDDAAARVEALARSMETADPEIYAQDIAALLELARSMRRSSDRIS